MRLVITHLKAPWPQGARVGDVIDLPEVPAWAVGKCAEAPEDAPATVEANAGQARNQIEELRAEAQAFIDRLKGEHEAQVSDLQAKLDAALAAQAELQQQLASAAEVSAAAEAKVADLQAKLDASVAKKK